MKKSLVAACVALAVCYAPAFAQDTGQKSPLPHITASGRAFIEVKPDIATLSLGVVSEKSTAAEATAENAQATTASIAVLKSLGVDPKDIKTTSLILAPVITEERDPKTNALIKRHVTSYRASNDLQARIRDVDKAGAIASRVVAEGSANTYNGLSFSVSDQEARKDSLRAKAVGDAMRKAELYAQGASMKLGRVLAIETEPDHNMIANAGIPMGRSANSGRNVLPIPVEPGVTRIEVRVSGVWELVPE
jgi:uncharacterized protein YggE